MKILIIAKLWFPIMFFEESIMVLLDGVRVWKLRVVLCRGGVGWFGQEVGL